SADFVTKAPDPRAQGSGYASMRRLPDGRGIVFAGFGAITGGNNAVAIYNPMADSWEIARAHTPWVVGPTLADGSQEARGRNYLGNRDNHGAIVSPRLNQAWFLYG